MVVDSKVPLASYERLIVAKDGAERDTRGKQFVRDVRVHIDSLGSNDTRRTKRSWPTIAC